MTTHIDSENVACGGHPARSGEGWRVGLLLVIAIVTFFVNNSVITPDIMESRNIISAREMVYDGHWLIPTMNGELRLEKPPLPTWVTAVAEMVMPDSLVWQRGMAGLAALLLVFYFYGFARRVLRVDGLLPALLLCTCYNVILMGRTASWDIYCHAFMMGAIYHLARACMAESAAWRHVLMAGLMMGLSIMSKGPVSLYALFLPFVLASFALPSPYRIRWRAVGIVLLVGLVIGGWWYAYVYLFHGDALSSVVKKESGAWVNHNVRPWWYYWKFFLETGVWSLLLLTAIFFPLCVKGRRLLRRQRFALLWMFLSLVLLSLLPEKKSRYLLPLLIPACYVMGLLVEGWIRAFRDGVASRLDCGLFRGNALLLAVVVLALPVAAWIYLLQRGYIGWGAWTVVTVVCVAVSFCLACGARRLRPMWMVGSVTVLFLFAECFALPPLKNIINNPEMKSIAGTWQMEELRGLPFYRNADEPMRIELVYAAHRQIRPLELTNVDSICARLPLVLLTHECAAQELPPELWERADSVYIGLFDDNRRPKSYKARYSDEFIYHVTLLKAKP